MIWGRRECAFLVSRAHWHLATMYVIIVNNILGLCSTLSRWPSNMVFEITLKSQHPYVYTSVVRMIGLLAFSLDHIFLSFRTKGCQAHIGTVSREDLSLDCWWFSFQKQEITPALTCYRTEFTVVYSSECLSSNCPL